ncbi:MAG: GNAT family N-acetyltransferase [Lachnospiraceae bacterium]|nr:GNAT family N-acetyltransferase [Lachnospiraceae bacterium]
MMENVMCSERLHYRKIIESDKIPLRVILSDPSITEPAGYKALESDDAFHEFFQKLIEDKNGIAVLLDHKVIGYFRIFSENMEEEPYKGKKCAGVGFVLGKEYHMQGYGTEILQFWTKKIKQDYDYCFADAFTDNLASNALIKKCGYRYVEDYSMYFEKLGKVMTCHSYVR